MTTSERGDRAKGMAGDLDPDIRRFVDAVSTAWARHPALDTVSHEEARRIAEQVRAPWTHGGPRMAAVTGYEVPTPGGTVRIRCYDPGAPSVKPALVYLHGGGWTLFSLDTHDRVMREYAGRTGMTVIGVDYALSPEARYPAALDQVCAVTRFLDEQGGAVGADPSRLALGGDSAGANLAIAAALKLRDEGRPEIVRALLLNYGVFDRVSSPEARRRFGGAGAMLSSEEMDAFWNNYLRDGSDVDDPLVCPVRADLRGLPSTLLAVPECDLLAEQSLRMAALLRDAGVAMEFRLYAGATHSFLEAVSIAPLAGRAFSEAAAWLCTTLEWPERS